MHTSGHTFLPAQITGDAADIQRLSDNEVMGWARRCDLHGRAWLELADIGQVQLKLALEHSCEVHLSGRRAASAEWSGSLNG